MPSERPMAAAEWETLSTELNFPEEEYARIALALKRGEEAMAVVKYVAKLDYKWEKNPSFEEDNKRWNQIIDKAKSVAASAQ